MTRRIPVGNRLPCERCGRPVGRFPSGKAYRHFKVEWESGLARPRPWCPPSACGCPMGHKRPHGTKGGPGHEMRPEVAAAMKRHCPTCHAVPLQRCIMRLDSGSTFQTRPDLGRRFFEVSPAKSHRARLRPPLPPRFQNVTLELDILRVFRERGINVKTIEFDGRTMKWTVRA